MNCMFFNFIVDFINQFKLNYKKIVVLKRKTERFLNRMNYKKKYKCNYSENNVFYIFEML